MAASNLKVRLLTAAVVVPPLLWLLFLGPAYGFFLLVMFAAAVAADELFRMTHPTDVAARIVGIVTTLAVSASLYLWGSDRRMLLTLLLVVPVLGLMVPLWRLGDIQSAALRMFAGVTGPLYVGGLLTALRAATPRRGHGRAALRLHVLDVRVVGRHRRLLFWPVPWQAKAVRSREPQKNRAGFVGALLGAELGGLLGHFVYLRSIPLAHVVLLALVAGSLGQCGDLLESLLKRSTGIKDSGSIVPGHGECSTASTR